MQLDVRRMYTVPKDLADQYDEKIADINKWLEQELVKLAIQPSVFRFIRRDPGENSVKARTEPNDLSLYPAPIGTRRESNEPGGLK